MKHIFKALLIIWVINFILPQNNFFSKKFKNHKTPQLPKELPKKFCGKFTQENETFTLSFFTEKEKKKIKFRRVTEDDYKPIRIFIDKTYIINQSENDPVSKGLITKVLEALEKVCLTLEKLIKVIPFPLPMRLTQDSADSLGFPLISNELKNEGVDTDLIILPIFKDLEENVLASAGHRARDKTTNRPILGVVNIAKNN